MGLVGPDEPRYAAIGRAMALSGDWITPRLWGAPWFEKPVLSYWMTGLGFRLGLGNELAPRLPVALTGALFLIAFYRLLMEEFGPRPALYGATILGTSAGWLAYSHIAVMDVPLTAAFSLAMLLACEWLRTGNTRRLPWVGALLGLGVLAKGLVPLILSAPLLWLGRSRWRDLWRPALALAAVALPWYAACYAVNGRPFFDEFIWKHHFARFFSRSLEHVQPVWFYIPVLLGGLYPWTPLAALIRRPSGDAASRLLWAWLVFGFVFWSVSVNKLPGYVLTLLPPFAALAGLGLERARSTRPWLGAAALLLALAPMIAAALPQAIEHGVRRAGFQAPPLGFLAAGFVLAAIAGSLERRKAVAMLSAAVAIGVWALTQWTYPVLDAALSARPRWASISQPSDACLDNPHRDLRYGLNYYAPLPLPDCTAAPKPIRIQ